ncbi:MFS transporter [Planomonospora parontospora]|uniref:MFS transporter n=1 Tax=Planomonospora parontospora TaxID=58119 RepID=UPI001E3FCB73|nr:MFS transporter [Planomonospora parontospora]
MRRLVPQLPRQAWLILGGDAVSALGTGLTLPFFLIYLHDLRGIELATAGPILSTVAVAGLVGNPAGGLLADRFGARWPAVAGLLLAAAGTAAMIAVRSAWQGFLAAGLYGLGTAIAEPAFQTLLGTSVPADRRSQVFSIRHAAINVGLSAGGLLAAFTVGLSSVQSFVAIYLLDAVTFLVVAAVIFLAARGQGKAPPLPATGSDRGTGPPEPGAAGGYREILTDRLLLPIWLSVVGVFAFGYAQLYSAYPVFATGVGRLSAAGLQLTFAVNTVTVVLGQLLVLRFMEGRRRTRGFALSAALMAAAWLIVLWAATGEAGSVAPAGFAVAMALFAVGETLLSPTVPAIVNDLASDSARGRYNGVYSLAGTAGVVIGPALAGVALGAGHGPALFGCMALALGLVALQALRLERLLPASANLVSAAPPGSSAHRGRTEADCSPP